MAKKETYRKDPKKNVGFAFNIIHKVIPVILCFACVIWVNQASAYYLDYDIAYCGQPWFYIGKYAIYMPILFITLIIKSFAIYNEQLNAVLRYCSLVFVIGIGLSVGLYFILSWSRDILIKDNKNTFGSARFSNLKDVKNVGLLANDGVVLGQWKDAVVDYDSIKGSIKLDVKKTAPLICYNVNVSGIVFAPTRSGKGISIVIPSLLQYPYSVIVLDPKSENFNITAGFRSKFSKIYRWAPANPKVSLHFNIMDEITEENAVADTDLIADIITSPASGKVPDDTHWIDSAKTLIKASILHCLCSDFPDKSLSGVYDFLTGSKNQNIKNGEDPREKVLDQMINGTHNSPLIHQIIVGFASQIKQAAPEERGSIFSSATTPMAIFMDPHVREVSSTSDFCLADFRLSEIPISMYLTVPYGRFKSLAPLFRILITFILKKFSSTDSQFGQEVLKNRLLFIIDEFASLGRIQAIEEMMGILNGYGISFLLICQSKSQLSIYGHENSLMDHCKYVVTYAMSDVASAEYFSKLAGVKGIMKSNMSVSGNRFETTQNNVSSSTDATQTNLINIDEITTMPGNSSLCFPQGGHPIEMKKVAYYSDKRFQGKINLPTPNTRELLLQECQDTLLIDRDEKHWYDLPDSALLPQYESEFESHYTAQEIIAKSNEKKIQGKTERFVI